MMECECGCGESAPKGKRFVAYHSWRVGEYTVNSETGCWEWARSRSREGYGKTARDGRRDLRAHRYYYEKYVGPIPDGMIVRHVCDNPPCVNPDHLEVGTHSDNTQDMYARGRGGAQKMKGKWGCTNRRVTDDTVREIKHHYATGKSLAEVSRMFADKCSQTTVWRIVRGRYHADIV